MPRFLIIAAGTLVLAGCSRPESTPSVALPAPAKEEDLLTPALEVIRQATEARHFRDGLSLLNGHLNRQDGKLELHLSPAVRKLLQEAGQLEEAEIDEVNAGTFRPLDAVHLDSCYLFRDAARALEVPGLSPLDQAALALGWVTRRVLLHEQHAEGAPPYLVVKRGFGGPRDRALVFLELLRQFQLDGCVVAFPAEGEPEVLLAGVFVRAGKGHELALFDPRLGRPLAGDKGQKVATLDAVKKRPELLHSVGIAAKLLDKAEVRLAYPASAAAPRMKYLEEAAAAHDRITLYQDIDALHRQAAGLGLKVAAWPAGMPPPPQRLARLFFPKTEGGVDAEGKLANYARQLVPMTAAVVRLQEMRLLADLRVDEARSTLLGIITNLLVMYHQQPHEMLLRGRYDAALARIDRIGSVIEQAEFAVPIEEQQLQRDIAGWRERTEEVHLSKDPRRVASHWAEDQYLVALMSLDGDTSPQRHERKTLTHIVLRATREPLTGVVDYIKAACWEEKAEKLAAQMAHLQATVKSSRSVQDNARNAWNNAKSAWDRYRDRAPLGPTQIRQRLERVQALKQLGNLELVLGSMEQLHVDLHQVFEARLQHAEALQRLGQVKPAQTLLAQVRADLAALRKDSPIQKELEQMIGQSAAQPPFAKRLELLARDWSPRGSLYWLDQRAERMLKGLADG